MTHRPGRLLEKPFGGIHISFLAQKLSEKGLSSGQTLCHQLCHGNVDPGFFGLTALFVVFAQASILAQPGKSSFHDPSAW
jgi:hypothetical protein